MSDRRRLPYPQETPGSAQGGGAPSAAPNVVSIINAAAVPTTGTVYPWVFSLPPITRRGSGLTEFSGDYGTASAYQLQTSGQGIVRKIVAAGAGQDALGAITPAVDAVTDYLPHVYSLVVTNGSSVAMSDPQGHCNGTVKEL